ncbi:MULTISPECIES: DUF4381 domain-containing protein [Crateriforma]|uniref:DUF4381 domain-containing protein n=1 Tax=Crateriforma conspicua TaxID=2527996 RepID=A0A5C6FXK5_9PLAN|nr:MULTISPECIES: DUF4381 domain-containing protein [Crateriforma]TWU67116.1 hypothetical protein V7x_26890 [Crateriforma conspicua]
MNDASTSLDRMHDIVQPADVSWWPPAPGWYVVMAMILAIMIWVMFRWWQRYQADAYRRSALAELNHASTVADVSAVLRRAALAVNDRTLIAGLSGTNWAQWLADSAPVAMPDVVRVALTQGIYDGGSGSDDALAASVHYAKDWVRRHTAMTSASATKHPRVTSSDGGR